MENSEVTFVELNRKAFDHLNDEDVWSIFSEARDKVWNTLTTAQQCDFHHHLFDHEETEKLFSTYDKIIVGSDDTIWGVKGESKTLLQTHEGLYEAALCSLK